MKKELDKIAAKINVCKKCPLWRSRKRAVPGEGPSNAKIMFVGQAPGSEENKSGRPFVGRAGKLLNEVLKKAKIERKKCFITSVIKCFPPKNRLPKKQEVEACKPYLLKQIEIIKPKIIVLLGRLAVKTLLGKAELKKIHGKKLMIDNTIYLATYHPSAARFPWIKKVIEKDLKTI